MNIKHIWDDFETSTEEKKWEMIRITRNNLLSSSDWSQLPDSLTEEQKAPWTAYRKALRDIPQTYINADDVVFPDEPVV